MYRTAPSRNGCHHDERRMTVEELLARDRRRRERAAERNATASPPVDEMDDFDAWEQQRAEQEAQGSDTEDDTEAESSRRGSESPSVSNSPSDSDSVSLSGDEFYEGVMVEVDSTSPPPLPATLPDKYKRLARVCFVLQGINGDEPFYLDARRAGKLLGIGAKTAYCWLMVLCRCGILRLVRRGNERQSNRYRFVTGASERAQGLPPGGHRDS